VIIAGGPTGVELAGARILDRFPALLSQRAEASLRGIRVEVRTSAVATRVTPDAVWLGSDPLDSGERDPMTGTRLAH